MQTNQISSHVVCGLKGLGAIKYTTEHKFIFCEKKIVKVFEYMDKICLQATKYWNVTFLSQLNDFYISIQQENNFGMFTLQHLFGFGKM